MCYVQKKEEERGQRNKEERNKERIRKRLKMRANEGKRGRTEVEKRMLVTEEEERGHRELGKEEQKRKK